MLMFLDIQIEIRFGHSFGNFFKQIGDFFLSSGHPGACTIKLI
jgi:hypothetical protein